jgi:plastocyanin
VIPPGRTMTDRRTDNPDGWSDVRPLCANLHPMSFRRLLAGTASALLAVVLLGGCTAKDAAPKSAPRTSTSASLAPDVQVVHLQADDTLHFSPTSINVKPGRIRVVFTVIGRMPHTFTSPDLRADSGNVPSGHQTNIDLIVPRPGSYSFYCAYHKTQGMTGTIVAQ